MTDVLTAGAVWQEGYRFEATTGTGHSLTLDASVEIGGGNAGPRPMELLLVANATCMGMDIVSFLGKMRQNVTGYRVRISGDLADEYPRFYTRIVIEHFLEGDIEEEKLQHAIELSEGKYCSVGAMLGKTATTEIKYHINSGD